MTALSILTREELTELLAQAAELGAAKAIKEHKPQPNAALWDVNQIAEYTGTSKAHVYAQLCTKPWFPRAIEVGDRAKRWNANEVIRAVEGRR